MLAKHALSQLSYGPFRIHRQRLAALPAMQGHRLTRCRTVAVATAEAWWAWEDLNFRPHAYQARALTN